MLCWFAELLHGTRSVPTTEARLPTPSPPRQQRQLPLDVLLEIAARLDPATVVSCAATSKPLRRGILDPSFRRRRLSILGGGSESDGFDPTLLLGFSYRLGKDDPRDRVYVAHAVEAVGDVVARVVRTATSPRPRLRIRPRLLEAFEPVASRDGLVVLRLDDDGDTKFPRAGNRAKKFHVWDALTARATSLPSFAPEEHHYPLALLNVAGGGSGRRSFEVLVADRSMRFKIFRSKTGRWGAERTVPVPQRACRRPTAQPAVVGRTVHWLCRGGWTDPHIVNIHALDLEAGAATTVELPPGCSWRARCYEDDRGTGILLASVGGRLSLLVAESVAISMWTLTSESSWSRQVVLSVREVETRAGLRFDVTRSLIFPVRLEAFGERSGAVVMQMCRGELVQLNLGTKEATLVGKYGRSDGTEALSHVFLHEMDLASLLRAMKSF